MPDAPISVLLVDEDLLFAARILSVVKGMGCHADLARTAEDAVVSLSARAPDLVIFNMNSASLGGAETIRRLKSAGAQRILARLSYVRIADQRAEILAAGVDRIAANSAISMRLPDIISRMMVAGPRDAEDAVDL